MIPDDQVRLSQMAPGGGCAAKIGPGTLQGILEQLPRFSDENLLVGIETNDDGAVYRISDELALIQTLDFFPPVVDNPWMFGQIAAANALSDIYAMGGEPKIALNIVAWPNCVNPDILGKILAGGAAKVKEAGTVLAGGHSIQDDVPKYGLSVTGFVDPRRMFTNCGARPGDMLLLTKPLGIGLVNTAVKAEMASERAEKEVLRVMTELNRQAAELLKSCANGGGNSGAGSSGDSGAGSSGDSGAGSGRDSGAGSGRTSGGIHACTDVTGFGLAGHGAEMGKGSGVTLEISLKKLPILPEAAEYASMGLVPEGSYRNREFLKDQVLVKAGLPWAADLVFDPQTSGGLLVSADPETAEILERESVKLGMKDPFRIIGTVREEEPWSVILTD